MPYWMCGAVTSSRADPGICLMLDWWFVNVIYASWNEKSRLARRYRDFARGRRILLSEGSFVVDGFLFRGCCSLDYVLVCIVTRDGIDTTLLHWCARYGADGSIFAPERDAKSSRWIMTGYLREIPSEFQTEKLFPNTKTSCFWIGM